MRAALLGGEVTRGTGAVGGLPQEQLDLGGGDSILRSLSGTIHGVSFTQSDVMNLAGRYSLNEYGLAGEYGGFTGLDDPEMCLVWLQPPPQGTANLEILNCDFEVLESLPMILE